MVREYRVQLGIGGSLTLRFQSPWLKGTEIISEVCLVSTKSWYLPGPSKVLEQYGLWRPWKERRMSAQPAFTSRKVRGATLLQYSKAFSRAARAVWSGRVEGRFTMRKVRCFFLQRPGYWTRKQIRNTDHSANPRELP